MKFKRANKINHQYQGGFTLAEVVAALLFMAIVIPVAVEGLRIASLAGEVSQRKVVAAQVGERVINELKVTGQLNNNSQRGTVEQDGQEYQWSLRTENWTEDTMRLVTVQISFPVRDRNYEVNLSTLASSSTP